MFAFTLAAASLLASSSPALPAEQAAKPVFVVPEQKLVGADEPIPLGELVELSASPIKSPPTYLASTSYTWRVAEDMRLQKFRTNPDGSVWWAAGVVDKTMWVTCSVTHLYLVKDAEGRITQVSTRNVILFAKVVIGKGSPRPGPVPVPPGPGPGPGPAPAPDPVFPDGQYKLAALAYKSAAVKVTDPTARTKGSEALARSYEGVASAIAAGTLKDLTAALAATKAANNKAIADAGVDAAKWEAFGVDLQDAVYALYQAKKINSVADLGTAWLEISAGLKKVK